MRASEGSTLLEQLCGWASRLELGDVPDRVVAYAQSQVLSQLAAARAGLMHPLGTLVQQAFGSPLQTDAARAACALSGLTPWLYFDDTSYAGHLSNSTVTVPLSYARVHQLDGRALLEAVIAANECAARITAAVSLSPFRGQNSPHTHLAGAIAGRMSSERAPAEQWASAFGIAFSLPPWPSLHGFISSDARVLSALSPVRSGLDACDAALAGLRGQPNILEHPDGFLQRFATVPVPEAVVAGLGSLWHTETLSFEVQPGGPVHDAAVDCAREIHRTAGPIDPEDVDEVVIKTSLYTILVDRKAGDYLAGPQSPIGALMFSGGYLVATALLTGGLTTGDFAHPEVDDPRRWRLAAKVRLEQDDGMTRASFRCVVPFGETLRLAGDRATPWLQKLGGPWLVDLVGQLPAPSTSFEDAEKVRPARVSVRFRDGRTVEHEVWNASGSAGAATRATHEQLVRDKFLSTDGNKQVADIAADLVHADADDVGFMCSSALDLTQ